MKTSVLSLTSHARFKILLLLLLCLVWYQNWSRSDTIVVPNGLQNVEGNSDNSFPFFIEYSIPARSAGVRYQQVYNVSELTDFEPEGGRITALWFRWDHNFAGPGTFITNIQINLSTTAKSADNLSMVFSENVGPDDLVVIGPGSLDVRGGGGGGNPSPFTIKFDLETPFDYIPSAGNLLLDVRNFTGGAFNPIQFQSMDAHNSVGDGISRMYAESVSASAAGVTDSLGLITQFEFTPIPEPTVVALIGLSAALWAGRNWSRGSRRRSVLVPSAPEPEHPPQKLLPHLESIVLFESKPLTPRITSWQSRSDR